MTDKHENPPELIQSVEQLLANADYRKAADLCEATQLQENLPQKFWFCRARALEALGDKARAIEAYRCEIASLTRVPPDLLGEIGALLMDVGRYNEAAICLSESCELSPSPDRLVLLACALNELDRHEQAREALQRAIEMDPANDEAWHNLGAYSLSAPLEAEQAFRRALELDPDRSDSYGGLADAYLSQGRTEEAVEVAQKGLAKNPLDGICHFIVGQGMELLGNLVGAEDAYSKAFRCDYDRPASLLGLARVLERRGRIDDALDLHLRGVRAWPDHETIRTGYLRFCEAHNCDDPAITELCKRCALLGRKVV